MELNWLPDHEAVTTIAGRAGDTLASAAAVSAIAGNSGLVPAAVDPHTAEVIWADVGERPLQEWQFLFSLEAIAKEDGTLPILRTRIADLEEARAAAGEVVEPKGFIFHMSRCGSTLLGNVLSGSPNHLVLNQPGPLQDGIWTFLTEDWTRTERLRTRPSEDDLSTFRDLVGLLLRRRTPEPRHGFIKFRSWAVLFLPFIQQAFPGVPSLFLYRDPREVLGSVLQKKNVAAFATPRQKAFLADCSESELAELDELGFMLACYAAYFKSALAAEEGKLVLLHYKRLAPPALPVILREVFGIDATSDEIDRMQEQFRYYSKDPTSDRKRFEASRDQAAKKARTDSMADRIAGTRLEALYEELRQSPGNLLVV